MEGILVGEVTHFYNRICVAVLDVKNTIRVGDQIHILGHSTDYQQKVKSLQIEHEQIQEAGPGMEVALKVERLAHRGDKVYKLIEEA